jgi:hypothetical protein
VGEAVAEGQHNRFGLEARERRRAVAAGGDGDEERDQDRAPPAAHVSPPAIHCAHSGIKCISDFAPGIER